MTHAMPLHFPLLLVFVLLLSRQIVYSCRPRVSVSFCPFVPGTRVN
jgi:hypothetical protein